MCVQIILGSVNVAEWPPPGKKLPRLTICSLCIMSICCYSYFPFWFQRQDFCSDCPVPGHYILFKSHILD